MDNIPDNVINKKLYMKAKKIANEKYKRHSAYKSMFIVKTYKDLGGKYSSKKDSSGVDRWQKERWLQVIPYLESGKKVVCGSGNNKKGCRPSVRVDKNTPITIQEVIKKHGKENVMKIAKKKKANMDLRVNWNTLKIY
jgi:hypothetical protein